MLVHCGEGHPAAGAEDAEALGRGPRADDCGGKDLVGARVGQGQDVEGADQVGDVRCAGLAAKTLQLVDGVFDDEQVSVRSDATRELGE